MAADVLAQLPRVLDAARWSDALIAAKDDQRLEPMLRRSIGIRETVLERMLRRQERRDARARDGAAEVVDEMAEVVLFLEPDGAIREEDVRAVAREVLDRVIGINPRVHARRGRQFRPRGAKLGRDDGRAGPQTVEKIGHAVA